MILSALVLPGAGQAMQKRWMPALIFSFSFILCFGAVCIYGIKIIYIFYTLPFTPDSGIPKELPLSKVLISFVLSILIYIISLIDTYLANLRLSTKWAKNRLNGNNPDSC